jgi:hypothetical protein
MEEIINRRVHIGDVVRNAIVFDFKKTQGGEVNTDNLLQTVARLFTLLDQRQIDYLLVGGIALLQYIEGRNTQDIDLIMAVSSLEKMPEIHIVERNVDAARGHFDELQIDLFLTSNPLFEKVKGDHATISQFVEQAIPTATVEGLLLLEMYALPSLYRQGNFARVGIYENDIAALMQYYQPEINPLLTELSKHISVSDFEAVLEIMDEIQQRIARFQEKSANKDEG